MKKKNSKKTALVAGASGLTGFSLVQLLLERETYEQIIILVRKPLNLDHPRLKQHVYDYKKPEKIFVNADHIYCCLGTTIKKAGSREAFREVDYEYPLQIARLALENGATRYALVSAMGANSSSWIFYNKIKGQVEESLRELPFKAIHIFRPSMLLGHRDEFRLGEEIGKRVMKTFKWIMPANIKAIHASQVAICMLDKMQEDTEGVHIIPSGVMQKYPVSHT